ncbi:MAG: hypothetical protein ABIQ60_04545 [Burkholderiaceae bacterium]
MNKGGSEVHMKWSLRISWLTTMMARKARTFDPNDPCDMGTAFGLEASMTSADEYAPELLSAWVGASALPWEHRLIRRSGL